MISPQPKSSGVVLFNSDTVCVMVARTEKLMMPNCKLLDSNIRKALLSFAPEASPNFTMDLRRGTLMDAFGVFQ